MAKELSPTEAELLAEANRINYRLRSTFFYRKLKEYNTLSFPAIVSELKSVDHLYCWAEHERWGIGQDAFIYINTHDELHLFQVFCHPKVLREHPRLVAYYRNIAALSQKSVGYLVDVRGINSNRIRKIETDEENTTALNQDQALGLSQLFNEHITLIIEASIQTLTERELYGILLASTGAQIDGSWRNAIGEEAEHVVQRLLLTQVKERDLLGALIPRTGATHEKYDPELLDDQLGNIYKYRGMLLTNKRSIVFSSEPDISLLDTNGETLCVMEVKGGADPAGALERYGAAKKSLEESRRDNAEVTTIFIASCITAEVRTRIQDDPLMDVL